METRLVVFPGSHFTLSTWLILSSWYVFPNVKADISCAPCMSPMQVNYAGDEHLRDPPDSGKYPRQDQKKPKLITVLYPNIGVPTAREVDGFPGIAPELERNAEEINSRAPLGNFTESALDEELFSDEYVKSESELEPEDAALGRVKRSVPEFLQSADARSEEQRKTSGLRVDGQSKRAEVRWNRDDEHDSRPDEPKLTSSTFALAGDSAHNHAVVYWTGKNSSVNLILISNIYIYNLNTNCASICRSTDYGSTYERLNDKVGVKTVLSYLYVCPTNKRKIMVLTDPEFESSILISSDEGASFQKYRLNFFVLSLLFHHTQEDWALAYSHDQKLYSSFDFGRKWQLVIHSQSHLISISHTIILFLSLLTTDCQYVTCRAQACSESSRTYPFSGYIETNSLVVQDEYVFVQVTTTGRASYYVSYQREPFVRIKIPKYSLPKDMHIVSTDQGQVFTAVQEWNQNDTYNLYISDTRGIYFTLALENVRTSRGLGGNSMIDLYEVAGIEGMLIANRKVENQVKTYITYNKGRDWRLLQAPTTDLAGNPIHCVLPFCSLHLQLQMSENPYLSGSISTKSSAPGVIVATGNIGSELSYNNVAMFISSDAGNNWRQIFEEEHNVWFLDKGGALVAVKQPTVPTRHLWISFDEGRQWTRHSFSAMPLFVDGVLVEAGAENQIMTFFGHFSHRSEWQLIKIDYKPIFTRRCTEGDYQTWHLHNQGEPCIMGQKQIYMKRRPGNYCMVGWDNSRILSAEPCICRAHDFEWYIFSLFDFFVCFRYRKVVANNCTKGVKEMYTARKQQCPNRPPRGLVLTTHDDKLTANMGSNVTFLVRLEEGDSMRTNIQLDFGDGTAVSYSNLSWTQEGIRHVYHSAGIFRVTALAENSLGFDMSSLHLHVTCPVEHIQLLAPYVVIKNKEVNLTAVVWPSHFRTLTYFWWLGNNTEPIITLDSSISHTFSTEGMVTVTVQVSSGDSILQDTRSIAIQEFFKSLLLSFSPNLDEANPDIPEWRQDVGRVIQKAVADIPEEQLLVAVFPGIPTAAELFLLPPRNQSDGRKQTEEDLEQISEILVNALNQISVEFELKPGSRVIVYTTQLTLAPLVDSIPRHSSSAMLMLLSVVFLGLAVFLIYKFKRKIPWINIYAEVNHEKEQEMISTVGQNDATPKITLSEFSTQKELMEKELEARAKRE
uniref:PKD domain-containing protein n=1 Tax=Cyprinus carpio TaxID=7962 RepID=A0A8C1YXS6_CYPCA